MPVGKKSYHKNAARSRQLIKATFAELLNEKEMSRITVTDIVERAGISRGTFYAHYLDIYDLKNALLDNIFEAVNTTIDTISPERIIADPSEAIRTAIEMLDKKKSYFRLFVTTHRTDDIIDRLMTIIFERLIAFTKDNFSNEDAEKHNVCLTYIMGGFKAVIYLWFDNDNMSWETCADNLIKFYKNSCDSELIEKASELIAEKEKEA